MFLGDWSGGTERNSIPYNKREPRVLMWKLELGMFKINILDDKYVWM